MTLTAAVSPDSHERSPRPRGARYVLLPGDPGRVHRLAVRLDEGRIIEDGGSMVRATGRLAGVEVIVAATGMGGPSTAATLQVLGDEGCDTFLRVGGAGPVIDEVLVNEIVIGTAAVRHEGASHHFLSPAWPAVADLGMVAALREAADEVGHEVRCGVLHTKDSFFGELDPDSSPIADELHRHWRAMQRLGVLASEMEAATLFAMALARGWRAGAVVKINDPDGSLGTTWTGDEDLCDLAVHGLERLIRSDGSGA